MKKPSIDPPKNLKFRPQTLPRQYKGKGYNWSSRRKFIEDHLARIFAHIHYLTDHAPDNVRKQWVNASKMWHKRMLWHKAGINERL